MKTVVWILFVFLISISIFCTHEKFPLPSIPPEEERFDLGEARYIQLNPPLDAANGYSFNKPSDIYVGADNFVYVADTENNRIAMMDAGGAILGYSQFIPHPEAITQNDSSELLIVNKTNSIFRIDMERYNHEIWNAAIVDTVPQPSEQHRIFTGITVHDKFEYYVTVLDTADSSSNTLEFSFIYDFFANHTLKGPIPLFVNGTGLYSAIVPTGIVSLRERYLDIPSQETTPEFIFCQSGKTSLLSNNFKVQSVTTFTSEGRVFLTPNTSLIGTDIYDVDKYSFPEDVTIDRSGFIYVVDKGAYTIDDSTQMVVPDTTQPPPGFYRFSSGGTQLQAVLDDGSGSQFKMPKGIAVTPFEGIVYVTDTGNDRILMFRLSTEF
jgi:DNA-binding beta-propeller fold protein YncE